MLRKLYTNARKRLNNDWRYKGITNRFMNKHTWSNTIEQVHVYFQNGADHHSGYVIEVTGENRDATLVLSNGFVETFDKALLMRDDTRDPTAFMHSPTITSRKSPNGAARQDEWLEEHSNEYEFEVIDPTTVKQRNRN